MAAVLLWRPSGLFGRSAMMDAASEARMLPQSRAHRLLLGSGAALLARAAALASPSIMSGLGTSALIAAMLALSLQLLVGCTGLVSLGHAAFYGLAAYTVYLVTPARPRPLDPVLTLPAAVAVAGLAALVVGALSLRTRGLLLPDGDARLRADGVLPLPRHQARRRHRRRLPGAAHPVAVRLAAAADAAAAAARRLLRLRWCCCVAMYLGLVVLLRSLFGRVLEGIRVNEQRMLALGFNTYRYKLAAFAIAGMLAGVAGHMWAMQRAS